MPRVLKVKTAERSEIYQRKQRFYYRRIPKDIYNLPPTLVILAPLWGLWGGVFHHHRAMPCAIACAPLGLNGTTPPGLYVLLPYCHGLTRLCEN